MNKTNILAIILFISFGITFVIASLLLRFKPDNIRFVKQKLKAGAALIIITAFFNGCGPGGSGIISCYEPNIITDDTDQIEPSLKIKEKDSLYQKFLKDYANTTKNKTKKQAVPDSLLPDKTRIDCYMEIP